MGVWDLDFGFGVGIPLFLTVGWRDKRKSFNQMVRGYIRYIWCCYSCCDAKHKDETVPYVCALYAWARLDNYSLLLFSKPLLLINSNTQLALRDSSHKLPNMFSALV